MTNQEIIETIKKKLKKAEDLQHWAKCHYFDSTTEKERDYYNSVWNGFHVEVVVLTQLLDEIE